MSRAGRAGLLLAALLGTLPACGKKGDPLPPLRPTPAAVTGVRVAQRGDELEIRFTAPRASTDGARLPVLEVELLVADQDGDLPKVAHTRRIKVAPGETLIERQPLPKPGTTIRVAARAIAKGNQGRPGELVRLTVVPPLAPPRDLTAELAEQGVSLHWQGDVPAPLSTPVPTPPPTSPAPGPPPDPSAPGQLAPGSPPGVVPEPLRGSEASGAQAPVPAAPEAEGRPAQPLLESPAAEPLVEGKEAKGPPAPKPTPKPFTPGFFIYRRAPEGSFGAPLSEAATTENAYLDQSARPGESWCYEVRAVASANPLVESASSNEACVEVKDILAPAPPTGLTVLPRSDGGVEIGWSPSPEADVLTYRVYRRRGGEDVLVAEVAAPETAFLDPSPPGRTLRYSVTAVDRAGNESAPSAPEEARRPE